MNPIENPNILVHTIVEISREDNYFMTFDSPNQTKYLMK